MILLGLLHARVAQDDDVLFHHGTKLEALVAHLQRNSQLALVAGCYYPAVCYAQNLVVKDRTVLAEHVPSAGPNVSSSLVHATLVQNAFVARVQTLRDHLWDDRQQVMEHETFFASLAADGHRIGFDPSVTLLHSKAERSYEYFVARHRETHFLQYMCRNFPRIDAWHLPFYQLDCASRSVTFPHAKEKKRLLLDWDGQQDRSSSVYRPGKITLFIIILSADQPSRVPTRDRLRKSWLAQLKAAGPWPAASTTWEYGFFIGNDSTAVGSSWDASRTDLMFGDIVRVDAPDDYAHLASKVLASLSWATEYMKSDYVLKVDEDTWVDAPSVAIWLQSHAIEYGGEVHDAPVEREGKWAVPREVLSSSRYPAYVKGGGYIIAASVARRAVHAIQTGMSPLIDNVEDATIGLAMAAIGVRPTKIDTFKEIAPAMMAIVSYLNAGIELPPHVSPEHIEVIRRDCCYNDPTYGRTLLYHKPFAPEVCDACAFQGPPFRRTRKLSHYERWPWLKSAALSPSLSPGISPGSLSPMLSPGSLSPMLSPGSLSPMLSPGSLSPSVLSPGSLSPMLSPGSLSPMLSPGSLSPMLLRPSPPTPPSPPAPPAPPRPPPSPPSSPPAPPSPQWPPSFPPALCGTLASCLSCTHSEYGRPLHPTYERCFAEGPGPKQAIRYHEGHWHLYNTGRPVDSIRWPYYWPTHEDGSLVEDSDATCTFGAFGRGCRAADGSACLSKNTENCAISSPPPASPPVPPASPVPPRAPPAQPGSVFVSNGAELEAALTGAAPEIVLADGTYYGRSYPDLDWLDWRNDFVIGRSVVLRALNAGRAILSGRADSIYPQLGTQSGEEVRITSQKVIARRVLYIDASHGDEIVLSGLVVEKGYLKGDEGGGGIRISGSQAHVTLNDCTIRDNRLDKHEKSLQGLQVSHGAMLITGSKVTLNHVDFHGNEDGFGLESSSSVVFNQCNFSANSEWGGEWGGAGEDQISDSYAVFNVCRFHREVLSISGSSNVVLRQTEFENAVASVSVSTNGSVVMESCHLHSVGYPHVQGVVHKTGEGSLTMDGCNITNNTALLDGGGFMMDGGSATLTNCVVRENQARLNVRRQRLALLITSIRTLLHALNASSSTLSHLSSTLPRCLHLSTQSPLLTTLRPDRAVVSPSIAAISASLTAVCTTTLLKGALASMSQEVSCI